MRVCLLTYRGNPYCGGQGIYVTYLATELIRLGHEVHIIQGPPFTNDIPGATIHKIWNNNYFGKKDFISKKRPFDIFLPLNFYEFLSSRFGVFPEIETFSIRSYFLLRKLLKKTEFDIIHDNQCLGFGFLLIKTLGVPFVSTIHHPLSIDRSTWFEYPSGFLLKIKRVLYYPLIMQSFVAKRMDAILTVSKDSASEITKAFGVSPEKISVVYNGIDTDIFRPLKKKKKTAGVIFVGNVEDRKKGVIYLLKAMTLARNKFHLTIVDGGAPNRKHAPQWIDRFGLNSRVTLTGKISNEKLIGLYCEHQIAVTPSLYEGFGFPAAEAMACSIPLVTSSAGALPEVAGKNFETCMIVPQRDPRAIADAIDFLMDNPVKAKKIAEKGMIRIQSNFKWDSAAKETVDFYKKAIHAYS